MQGRWFINVFTKPKVIITRKSAEICKGSLKETGVVMTIFQSLTKAVKA